jgi:AhpD family alkylhydroperoxidase
MRPSSREPRRVHSQADAEAASPKAAAFNAERGRLNAIVAAADNPFVKRFYNLDHNAYLEGAIPARYKELIGLAVSAALRCDDCVNYHVLQSYYLGVPRKEQEEALDLAMLIGGSIVIPHLRRAYELLSELYPDDATPPAPTP